MKNKSLKILEEAISYLVATSEALSYEQRVRRLKNEHISNGQEELVKAIEQFTIARDQFKTLDKELRTRQEKIEEDKE